MASALQCDICGAFYVNKDETRLVRFGKRNQDFTVYLPAKNTYDLCPDCFNAIQKVIEERKGTSK